MSQPRHPISAFTTRSIGSALPTGTGFGGSNLNVFRRSELLVPSNDGSVVNAQYSVPIYTKQSSLLIVKVGKIFVLSLWLWCAIGADFCFNSVRAISTYKTQDVWGIAILNFAIGDLRFRSIFTAYKLLNAVRSPLPHPSSRSEEGALAKTDWLILVPFWPPTGFNRLIRTGNGKTVIRNIADNCRTCGGGNLGTDG